MVKNSQKSLIYCLILLSLPLTGGGLDIFAAGLPYIVKYYHTTQFFGQMSVTFYLLGLAIGSVVLGVVSDYCPYRPLLFVGCLIFSVISFLICMTTSIQLFLVCRFAQGLAVSAPAVVTKGYLGKLFSGHELSRKSAGMSIAWSVGLVIFPIIGGYLVHYFNWKMSFVFLGTYSLIVTATSLLVTYKNPVKFRGNIVSQFLGDCRLILSNRIFLGASITNVMVYAIIAVYNTMAPFLLSLHMHVSPKQYGHVSLFLGLSWVLGGLLNGYLTRHYKPLFVLKYGLIIYFLVAVLSGFSSEYIPFTVISVMIPMLMIYFIGGTLLSYGISLSMHEFKGAEGLLTSIRLLVSLLSTAILSFLCAFIPTYSILPMLMVFSVMSGTALVAYFLFLVPRK